MTKQRSTMRLTTSGVAVVVALAMTLFHSLPAQAEEEIETAAPKRDRTRELLDKLREKGVITEDEYKTLTEDSEDDRAAARATTRAERRKKALQEAQAQQQAESRRESFTGRFNNGINFETQDRRNSFTFGGRIDADYRRFFEDTAANTFDVRRAYLTVQGKWNEWLTWDLTGDFAQSNVALDVAWVNAAWTDALQFRVGQFKMPFSMEQLQSSRFLDFQERSMVDNWIPAKERGFMMHGVPRAGVYYGVALSTGQGKNANDVVAPRSNFDLIGRGVVNFAEVFNQQQKAVYHFGLAASQGELPTGFGLNQRSEARGLFFFNTASFSGQDVRRTRLGAEAALAYGPFKFTSEYVNTKFDGSSSAGQSYNRSVGAYYVAFNWMVTGEPYADSYRNGLFGRIVPIRNFNPGGDGWGALQVGLRFSSFDASDFSAGNAAGTGVLATAGCPATTGTNPACAAVPTNRANAITLGLKWIWNPNLSLYVNYIDTRYDTNVTVNPNYGGLGTFGADREKALTTRVHYDW